jgi:uncharacterized protein (TIGR04255 family)
MVIRNPAAKLDYAKKKIAAVRHYEIPADASRQHGQPAAQPRQRKEFAVSRENLKNKPLVEAILEIRWDLVQPIKVEGPAQMVLPAVDPHYRLLLGRLFDRFQKEYPFHEQLPTATLPDEVLGHVVQHRFRSAKDEWPLVQVGPGVFTVNDTQRYTWSDFQQRSKDAVVRLYDAHPAVAEFHVQSLMLRYIDAVEYNYKDENAFAFLSDKLKVGLSLPETLFQETGVESRPHSFTWQATFRCPKPAGKINVGFATGQREEKPAILWETTVQSMGGDLPNMPDGFPAWIDAAHEITADWFFKLIEGELERRFQGE